jgi:hypothetical protein
MAVPIFSFIVSMNREKDNKDDMVGFLSRKLLTLGRHPVAENRWQNARVLGSGYLVHHTRYAGIASVSLASGAGPSRTMRSEMISVSPVLFSAGFRHRQYFTLAGPGWNGGKRDDNVAAAAIALLCCSATAVQRLYRSLFLLLSRRFITTLPE